MYDVRVSPPRPAAVRSRIAVEGRPSTDGGCAGCAQLVPLRALRRAGVAVQGCLGCDPDAEAGPRPAQGRWAAVTGPARVLDGGARALLDAASAAGAAFVLVTDDDPARARSLEVLLAAAGAHVHRAGAGDHAAWEALVAHALAAPAATVLLSVEPCARGAPAARPALVATSRCNRCGACLSLGCPALSDPGEEAMWVDPGVCTGCGLCAPLCRGRALAVGEG